MVSIEDCNVSLRLGKPHSFVNLQQTLYCASSQALGVIGEMIVASMFADAGMFVSRPALCRQGDLTVVTPQGEILRVEVKTSRRGADGSWQFNLRKRGKTDVDNSDYVVLLQVNVLGDFVPYLIPVNDLPRTKLVKITTWASQYTGKYASYKVVSDARNSVA